MSQLDNSIIFDLQIKLDLQTKENLNYINLISEQKQEIENLKSKIEFLEKENNKLNNNTNNTTDNTPVNKSVISRMMSWIR
jgi:predicted nuclease with TOPRIM domain